MNAQAAARDFARAIETEGTRVLVRWTQTTGGTVRPDTGARTGGTTTPCELEFKAFHHFSEADVRAQRYAQVEVGELFLDFVPGTLDAIRLPAAGVEVGNVVFTTDGQDYTQSKVGQGIATFSDALHGAVRISSTVRLTRLR